MGTAPQPPLSLPSNCITSSQNCSASWGAIIQTKKPMWNKSHSEHGKWYSLAAKALNTSVCISVLPRQYGWLNARCMSKKGHSRGTMQAYTESSLQQHSSSRSGQRDTLGSFMMSADLIFTVNQPSPSWASSGIPGTGPGSMTKCGIIFILKDLLNLLGNLSISDWWMFIFNFPIKVKNTGY